MALLSAPTLELDPIYSNYNRPGWHSSGLPLVEELQASLAYLSATTQRRQPAVLTEKAMEFAGERGGACTGARQGSQLDPGRWGDLATFELDSWVCHAPRLRTWPVTVNQTG